MTNSTKTISGEQIQIRIGDRLELRGIGYPMEVMSIDAFGIVSLRRVHREMWEMGEPYRSHLGDLAIVGFAGEPK